MLPKFAVRESYNPPIGGLYQNGGIAQAFTHSINIHVYSISNHDPTIVDPENDSEIYRVLNPPYAMLYMMFQINFIKKKPEIEIFICYNMTNGISIDTMWIQHFRYIQWTKWEWTNWLLDEVGVDKVGADRAYFFGGSSEP